ncbi:MAG: hypothetical protein M1824_006447 [Vezdaea acicularis]|nr:MAG: hypothetical protein M1824_006447 [Vezdaea acicularis]
MSSSNASLQATFQGYVATTHDALILFEACLTGQLQHVPRRPHDRERTTLIRSGCVFIYEENASGIKRWTDGVPWSPSRILGNFLVYRELERPFPPGEKKRATKRSKRATKPGEPYPRSSIDNGTPNLSGTPSLSQYSPTTPSTPSFRGDVNRDTERALIGSLVDSYGFKEDGLVKKTMSVSVRNVHHHLVSYYKVDDVLSGKLVAPSAHPSVRNFKPRTELTTGQNFRSPLNEEESLDATYDGSRVPFSYADRNGYERRPTLTTPSYHSQDSVTSGFSYSSDVQTGYQNGNHTYSTTPTSYTGSAPTPATGVYYSPSSAGSPHTQIKSDEYAAYTPGAYGHRYDHIGGSLGALPASHSDRPYVGMRMRAGEPEQPAMIDTKMASDGFKYPQYSNSSRSESHTSYQPLEQNRWGHGSASARSDAVSPYAQWGQPQLGTPGGHYANQLPHAQWPQQ